MSSESRWHRDEKGNSLQISPNVTHPAFVRATEQWLQTYPELVVFDILWQALRSDDLCQQIIDYVKGQDELQTRT